MEEFSTSNLIYCFGEFDDVMQDCLVKGAFDRERMDKVLKDFHSDFARHRDISDLASHAMRLMSALNHKSNTKEALWPLCREFRRAVYHRLISMKFFAIESRHNEYFSKKNPFGGDVPRSFPSAIYDIEEAGKCLALDRYTACVFHLMRVLEIALRALAKKLNDETVDPERNPSWERILNRIRCEMNKDKKDRSPEWLADEEFLVEAAAHLQTVKNAWRNPTVHPQNSYTVDEAGEIFQSVKAFMKHVAPRLEE